MRCNADYSCMEAQHRSVRITCYPVLFRFFVLCSARQSGGDNYPLQGRFYSECSDRTWRLRLVQEGRLTDRLRGSTFYECRFNKANHPRCVA